VDASIRSMHFFGRSSFVGLWTSGNVLIDVDGTISRSTGMVQQLAPILGAGTCTAGGNRTRATDAYHVQLQPACKAFRDCKTEIKACEKGSAHVAGIEAFPTGGR
jgi:hypothetical protein